MLCAQGLPTLLARSRSAVAAQPARMGSGRTSGVLRERRGGSTGSVSHSGSVRGGESKAPPYDPRLMTKLLYGYSMGLFGVQRMAQRNVIIRHLPGCRNFGFGKQNLPRRNWHAYTYGDDGGICHYRRISLQRYGPGLHNRRSNPGKRKAAGENPVLKLIGPSRHTLQRFGAW